MSGHKDSFKDRLKNASAAKATALSNFQERPKADDPKRLQRQAERTATNIARDARSAKRHVAKETDAAAKHALKTERAEQQESDEASRLEHERAAEAEIKQSEADKKTARDARYAARKARR